ncbi:MAG: GntP family permease [Actinomycetota bacterium]|nr:GntP family permease [Actinomycetota bacterium]
MISLIEGLASRVHAVGTPLLAADGPTPAEKAKLPWTGHDTRLLLVAVIAIAVIVVLIAWLKMHPFLALILGSAVLSIAGGVPIADSITHFEKGVGDTLKEVGLLIALGGMLGKLLADSGGANQVVDKLIARARPAIVPWMMALVAAIVGLPMFFEIGLVLLLPVIVVVASRTKLPLMKVGIPALAGLSVLHGFIPPHPGPLIAIAALGAPLGLTLAFGLLAAIPTVIIGGPLFAMLAARWVPVAAENAPMARLTTSTGTGTGTGTGTVSGEGGKAARRRGSKDLGLTSDDAELTSRPSFGVTVGTILFPVVLMLLKALADIIWAGDSSNKVRTVVDFIGEPLVAMTLAVLLAMVTFGYAVGFNGNSITKRLTASVGPIASVILIVGAGGGFKQSLISAGVGDTVAKAAVSLGVPTMLLGFLLAVVIRLATGSATVATTTAAGIIAGLATGLSPAHAALLALAIGAGSLFLSHVNDAGFWLVKESFGLTVGQTFKTWSLMECIVSVVGFLSVLVISIFV